MSAYDRIRIEVLWYSFAIYLGWKIGQAIFD